MRVTITPEALAQIIELPRAMRPRVDAVVQRLKAWPQVSGVKWLVEDWKGFARIRTGDYRVIFTFAGEDEIQVVPIADRRDAYAD